MKEFLKLPAQAIAVVFVVLLIVAVVGSCAS